MNSEEMDKLASAIERGLKRDFTAMVREMRDSNDLGSLVDKIANGSTSILEGVDVAAEKFATEITAAYVRSGQKAAREWSKLTGSRIKFDINADEVGAWIEEIQQDIVRTWVAEQEEVAHRVIADGRARGLTDEEIAAEVRGSIGIAPAQLDYVESYRDALETQNYSNALDRELADGRYDRALENADANDVALTDERIDTMVDRYRDNWIDRRGDNIAEAEANNAAHAGVDELLTQAMDAGDVEESDVTRTWHTRHDSKVRSSHRVMDGQNRGANEPFMSGFGNELRFPGDDEAPAEDTAGCRCRVSIDLNIAAITKRFEERCHAAWRALQLDNVMAIQVAA